MYNVVEPYVVRYPYDPRESARILEGLGYAKRAPATTRATVSRSTTSRSVT